MTQRRLINPFAKAATPELRTTGGHTRSIPEDLLRQAFHRLAILALVGAALWFLGPALGHVAAFAQNPPDPHWAQFQATDFIAVVSIMVSLALYLSPVA